MAVNRAYMQAVLDDFERSLPNMTWKPMPTDMPDKTAKVYEGRGEEWTVTVAAFSTESQGFPAGSRGYDAAALKGTSALKGATVLRLTPELAAQAFAAAEKWCFLAGIDPA